MPALLLVLLLLAPATPDPGSKPDQIAFVHAQVLPMDEERVLPDQTVVVAKSTVVEIDPSGEGAVAPARFDLCRRPWRKR